MITASEAQELTLNSVLLSIENKIKAAAIEGRNSVKHFLNKKYADRFKIMYELQSSKFVVSTTEHETTLELTISWVK